MICLKSVSYEGEGITIWSFKQNLRNLIQEKSLDPGFHPCLKDPQQRGGCRGSDNLGGEESKSLDKTAVPEPWRRGALQESPGKGSLFLFV